RFTFKQRPTDAGPASAITALAGAAPATLFALDALRNVLFTAGSMVGILEVYLASLILLAPFCLTSGLLFTRLTALNALWPDKSSIGKVYAWESIGSVAGGALFNFVLVFFLRPFEAFGIIIAVNALLLGIWAFTSGVRSLLRSAMFIGFVFSGVIVFLNPDIAAKKLLLPGQQILKYTNSPFGDIVFSGSEGQMNLYENNTLIYTTNNIISNEESVHYAMLQRDNPKNVLLIGGCFPGVIGEVLKYPVKKIDCIEMSRRLLEETKSTLGMPDDKRFNVITGDPVLNLRKNIQKVRYDNQDGSSRVKYDVVLLNLPDPYTLQLNRFYSLEFMQLLKPLMTDDGVVSLSLTATADYMGFSSRKVQSVMYATLKHIFSNVMVIPGDRNHFVASDSPVRIDVAALQVERGIETQYVNPYYIDDQSISERSQVLMKAIDAEAPVNHDFEPVAFKSQLDYWLDYFGISLRLLPVVLLLVILAVLLRSDGIGAGVFMAGFAASASEIAVLLAFQVLYGYVFIAAGMFITLFMLGLAIGAVLGHRYFVNPSFKAVTWLQVCMSVAMLAVSGVIYGFYKVHWSVAIIHIGFGLILLAIAMLTGIIFQVTSVVKKGEVKTVAGSLYGSDLLGSAIGALLMSIFMIPELGLFKSLLSLTVLCLFSVLVMLLKRKPVL
ncbi:MAG TPA: hypothetical protein PLP88_08770, partial [Bacteroidales bacterium]|nr:hypothetical protein [Bacteroidales bacterium]